MAKVRAIDILKERLKMYRENPQLVMKSNNWSEGEFLEEVNKLETKISQSKRGKSSKVKGASYERKVAKAFKDKLGVELVRTPLSGGFQKSAKDNQLKGDISNIDSKVDFNLHVECKSHKSISLQEWLRQSEDDCPKGKIPTVVFHRPNTSIEYIVMSFYNFINIIDYTKSYKNTPTELVGEEIWIPIKGYEGHYEISNRGFIRSLKNNTPRLLNPSVSDSGYLTTALTMGGKCKSVRIHNLVAKHFVEPFEGEVINHLDGDKLNNFYKNLEFVTYSENNSHAYLTGLKKSGEECYLSKLSNAQVLEIKVLNKLKGLTPQELVSLFDVSITTINRILKTDYRNPLNLFITCKDHASWSVPKWIEQSESDCPEGKVPIVVMHRRQKNKDGQRVQENGDYVVMDLFDFLEIVNYNKIIKTK